MTSWIALHPQWFLRELELLNHHHPGFRVDERRLDCGELVLWGELKVRPPGGTQPHAVKVVYPDGTPYEHPVVYPISGLPNPETDQLLNFDPVFFDHRHQMPAGNLCLFQRDTRGRVGGDVVNLLQILRRTEQWFMGLHTGRWPPDTADSELEAHFSYAADVLLAGRFFASDVRGRGRFYMIPDIRRMIDRTSDYQDACPMIVTAMTEESNIVKVLDARSELSDVYPWIGADHWDPYKLAAIPNYNIGKLGHDHSEQGYWWTLPTEPRPFRGGGGLLRTIQTVAPGEDAWRMVADTLGGELSAADRHYIALQYPARNGGIEWLFLVLPHKSKRACGGVLLSKRADQRREFENLRVLCYRTHSIRDEDLVRRNQTVVDQVIRGKTVALIGLGALGSRVAELLAQAGVARFRLCDSDRFKTSNVSRHIGGISDFGATKVRVVMSRLLNINPRLRFIDGDTIIGNADASLDQLTQFMSPADLIVSTTADEGVESVVNQVAVTMQKPVIYGRSLRRSCLGRIFLVRPGRDACKVCLAEYARAAREGKAVPSDWIDVREGVDDVLLHECGRPVIAGSAADLSFVATLTARIAIDFLEGKTVDANHWLWARDANPEIDARLNNALSTFCGLIPPSDGCTTCREPPITEVLMDDANRNFIVAETEGTPHAETGGVLIGYVDEWHRAIVTRAIGPGPKAVKTATRFQRDIEYAQHELHRAATELGDRGAYLGEWHSHLEAAPEPSPTDVRSLNGIASAPNYLTSNPVMVIAGYDPVAKKVVTVRSWVFVAGGRFFRVANAFDRA